MVNLVREMWVYIVPFFQLFLVWYFSKWKKKKQVRGHIWAITVHPKSQSICSSSISFSNENCTRGWLLVSPITSFLCPSKVLSELFIHKLNLNMSLTYLKHFQDFCCPIGQLLSLTQHTRSSVWRSDGWPRYLIFPLKWQYWNSKT